MISAQGTDLSVGATCRVQVMLNAKRHAVLEARAECGGRNLYDSYGREGQYATKTWKLERTPSWPRGFNRYRVLMGSRLVEEGEVVVNTFERKVTVWSTKDQFKVQIQVAKDSEPLSGEPIDPPDE